MGIILQLAAVIAVFFSGVKYLSKKLDEHIEDKIQEKIQPAVKELCKQIGEVSQAIKDYDTAQKEFQAKTNVAIKFIDRAVMRLESVKEDEIIKRQRGEDS